MTVKNPSFGQPRGGNVSLKSSHRPLRSDELDRSGRLLHLAEMAELASRYGEQSMVNNNLGDRLVGRNTELGATMGESDGVYGIGGTGDEQIWNIADSMDENGNGMGNYGGGFENNGRLVGENNYVNTAGAVGGNGYGGNDEILQLRNMVQELKMELRSVKTSRKTIKGPKVLTKRMSPKEFNAWEMEFRSWFVNMEYSTMPAMEQQLILSQHVEPEILLRTSHLYTRQSLVYANGGDGGFGYYGNLKKRHKPPTSDLLPPIGAIQS